MLYFILIIFILCLADSLTTCFVGGGGGTSGGFVVVVVLGDGGQLISRNRLLPFCSSLSLFTCSISLLVSLCATVLILFSLFFLC